MRFWLVKSEPDSFSWDDQVALGAAGGPWDGIRNYQARNNMRAMALGDRSFFYHSNMGKEIVGVVEVCALSHRDPTTDDPRWDCVDFRAIAALPRSVTLTDCKSEPALADMALVRQMRLSVQPVTALEWQRVCDMACWDGALNLRA